MELRGPIHLKRTRLSHSYWSKCSACSSSIACSQTLYVYEQATSSSPQSIGADPSWTLKNNKFFWYILQSLHYSRMRLALLPLQKPASERSSSLDVDQKENEIQFKYLHGFLRFLETVNRIRRPPIAKVKVSPKKTPKKSRRPSAPAMMKSPSSVRIHRRSRSGGANKDLGTLDEDGTITSDSGNPSPGQDINRWAGTA